MDCVFCKIVKGEIPAEKVYEDESVLAFLSIGPISKGHTLVIPKKHFETLLDIEVESLKELMHVVQEVSVGVKRGTGAAGLNVVTNVHGAAGQVVPHLHWHIIPREHDDGLKGWPEQKYVEGEIRAWGEKIRKEI